MTLIQYPQRQALHNEVHARPPEATTAPIAIAHVVMLANPAQREASRAHVSDLLRNRHLPLPDTGSTHIRMDLGQYRLRWEMHTEFVTWTFMRTLDSVPLAGQPPPDPASRDVRSAPGFAASLCVQASARSCAPLAPSRLVHTIVYLETLHHRHGRPRAGI